MAPVGAPNTIPDTTPAATPTDLALPCLERRRDDRMTFAGMRCRR
jgi:hypothetical protein